MSRSKKTRKPGLGSSGAPKADKKAPVQVSDKKPKKKSGKASGNRQLEAIQNKKGEQQNPQSRDPRLGSKKPIALVKETPKKQTASVGQPKQAKPIAAIRKVEPSESMQERLIVIEEDEKLLAIIAKQEAEVALSEEEIDYFNNLMDEHAKISDILGLNDDDDEVKPRDSISEDDLWDKLDNSDFSQFSDDKDE